ncbi:tetratricopeptide repeat protein [Paludisphaera borealis]|uniref:Beta-barrel assembly-enhancing protease n=1 Tax=Paludisphaera borealis TaxID=1387353 RepID=A0A1U7CRA6_9BACT|nr:tetratricopeptide repeat protein [Paludisphaera borealis]APW61475.1 Beta-barrel assembly-enhancing protease [Paludisphaera borealis]
MGNDRSAIPAASRKRARRLGWRAVLAGAFVLVALGGLGFKLWEARAIHAAARDAKRLIEAGAFQEAGASLDRWLAARPDDAEARFFAARRAIGLQRFDDGLRGLQSARKLGYPAAAVDREQGLVLARAGRLADAEPILQKLFRQAGATGQRDAEVDEALARCYIETFQLRAAEAVVKQWIVDAPDDARAYYWKADIDRRKTDTTQDVLIAGYEQVVRLDPRHEKGRLALAELYLQTHRYDDAASQYEVVRASRPDDVEALLGLGRVAVERGEDDEAARCFDRAADVAPNDFRPLSERGKLEMKRGRFRPALGFFDRAVALDADEPEVHYQRSLVLTWLGRADEAKKETEETTRLQKQKAEIDAILDDLRKSPKDASIQYAAARWLIEHGHPEEGLRWAEKNVREHPTHAKTHHLLADYYQRRGDAGLANFHKLQAGER